MNAQTRASLKFGVAIVLAVASAGFLVSRAGALWTRGEAGARVWFYDQSEKRLYPLPSDTIPPHKGIGGKSDDGVRAVVVAFRGEQSDPQKRRIAYLETYAPELKQLLERVRSAHATHQKHSGPIPARDSDYYQSNTLVKRPEDGSWFTTSSHEGQRLLSEWRSWRGPGGQPPIVCAP